MSAQYFRVSSVAPVVQKRAEKENVRNTANAKNASRAGTDATMAATDITTSCRKECPVLYVRGEDERQVVVVAMKRDAALNSTRSPSTRNMALSVADPAVARAGVVCTLPVQTTYTLFRKESKRPRRGAEPIEAEEVTREGINKKSAK